MQSGLFRRRILLALVLLPLLGGCSSYVFGPKKVGSSSHLEFQDEGKDKLVGDATMALYKEGTIGVLVGWEHSFQAGNDSKDQIYNRIYRGAVRFDVDPLVAPPAKTVTKAILSYTVQNGAQSSSKGSPESCATKLLLATEGWLGAPETDITKAPDTIPGDLYKDGLPEKPVGSIIRIDVTDAVKAWTTGAKPNYGFVFAGSTEEKGLIKDNDKCWTLLGGFSLRVNYSKL
ncbi:DNRLRE domain-containing protein [Candidatus Methylomirabilis sp.]|uniref:DNRLRE domain-containing protein n=1 Tax=Candidatus Methylomirabilis sp. TaxID=2032687 RepID=UPI003075F92C